MSAVWLLALTAAPQTLTDEVLQIPARKDVIRIMNLEQVPVVVDCEFHVTSGTGGARAVVVNADGLDSWKQGNRDQVGAGRFLHDGGIRRLVNVPDDYAVIVENGGNETASVRLRIALDYSRRGLPQPRYLSTKKRVVVILISATVFLAIVGYSAKRLAGLMR